MPHIAIVGLGFIGGSLGLALRRAKVDYEIVGHDRDFEIAGQARKRGAVDRAEWNLPAAIRDAGLVIVAVPLDVLPTVFQQLAPHLAEGCVVTDTASVKRQVLAWAAESLPPRVSFVGGHPMTGKEETGIEHAAADLFLGRAYCLTPPPAAAAGAIELAAGLAEAVGAKPYFLDPAEHDSFAAAVGHLPFLTATALIGATTGDPAWRDAAPLAASEFDDATRLAGCDPAAYRAICRTNRAAILRWMDVYGEQLAMLRRLIAADATAGEELERAFRQAREARDKWQQGPSLAAPEPSIPRPGDQVRQMLIGRLGERRRM